VPVPLEETKHATKANIISVGMTAWKRYEDGMVNTLCLMEDPRQRGDLNVVPRKLQYDKVAAVHEAWKFDKSSFKEYSRETEQIFISCFDHDIAASKLGKYVDKYLKAAGPPLVAHLRKHYQALMAAFHGRAFRGFSQLRASSGLSLLGFTDILGSRAEAAEPSRESQSQQAARGKARKNAEHSGPVFNSEFPQSLADTVFIGANVIDKDNKLMKDMSALPNQGLCRFQFLEAFTRLAIQRYQQTGEQESAIGAVKELQKVLNLGQDILYMRSTLQQALFVEECCLVIKQNKKLLEETYAIYCKRLPFPGKGGGKTMSYGAWLEFLQACNASDFGLSHLDSGLAFALGKEIRIDEFRSFRHMELSLSEFIVCVGAAVRLSGKFQQDFLSDRLLEFIEEHVTRAAKAAGASAAAGRATQDPALSRMVTLVGEMFSQADEDQSGFLSFQEFNTVIRQKRFEKSMKDAGISAEDFKTLFLQVDTDKSGTVTLDELCEGLLRMKKAMVGVERTIAFMRKMFEESDEDGSGSLSKDEFHRLFQHPTVRTKLQQMDVSIEDIDDLWAAVDAQDDDGQAGVSSEEMVAGFLSLRQDGSAAKRGMNFLRQVFKAADEAGNSSASLSSQEIDQAFYAEDVTSRLERLGLAVPDWLGMFDAIDVNGDGELSWEELSKAISATWGGGA